MNIILILSMCMDTEYEYGIECAYAYDHGCKYR